MKRIISKIIYSIPKVFLRKILLMESNPDYSDNTKAVFDELLKRKINDKIKIVWIVNNLEKFKNIKIKNVKFIKRSDKLKVRYYHTFSSFIIDSNKYIYKINKHQKRIHLRHGETLKLSLDYCSECKDVDYIIELSSFFTDTTKRIYKVSKDQVVATGFPRNDIIVNGKPLKLFPDIKRKKTILWMPTYRNHKETKRSEYQVGKSFIYGIPCVSNKKELLKVNDLLREQNVLLIVKLHPAEDKTNILKEELSNIVLLDNDYFKNDETIYNYLSGTDALITDYSSIYYDYLLTGKMIGLAIPDIDEYKKHVELLFDSYKNNVPGDVINNNKDLCQFIINVSNNKDLYKKERIEKAKLYHEYNDGNSSKRVADLFEDILKKG